MITLAWFNYDDLLPFIGKNHPNIIFATADGQQFSVKASSNRLECFKRSPRCVNCPRIGSIFLLQKHTQEDNPHLNLYAFDGTTNNGLTLMTQDHIIPKFHCGSDDISNLQTMCRACNHRKGCLLPHEFEMVKATRKCSMSKSA